MAGFLSGLPYRLIIAFTVLGLIVALPDAVDSRHKKPKRRNSIAVFTTPSPPEEGPDLGFVIPMGGVFTCVWWEEPLHDYGCAPGPAPALATFSLLAGTLPNHGLDMGDNYPHEPDVDGWGPPFPLASPDIARQFTCHWAGAAQPPTTDPTMWQCSFTYNAHTHRFRVADIVSLSYENPPVNPNEQWIVPCDGSGPCPEEDPPPQTTIGAGPPAAVASRSAALRFASSEPGSTFACRLDTDGAVPCASPARYDRLSQGRHTFEVAATDDRGKVDATPARRRWLVDVAGPRITISRRTVRLTRRGAAKVRVRCRASEASGPCVGRLRLLTVRRAMTLGAKQLRLIPGRAATARVRFLRRGRRLVRRAERVRVLATVRASDALGNLQTSSARFRVRAP